jgi:hypothetical protein
MKMLGRIGKDAEKKWKANRCNKMGERQTSSW